MNSLSRRTADHVSYRTLASASIVLVLLALGSLATTTVSLSARAARARVDDSGRRSNQRISARGPAALSGNAGPMSLMSPPPPP